MPINVPDMSSNITGLVKTPVTKYQDFRLRSSQIRQNNAVASRYEQSAVEDKKAAQRDARRRELFQINAQNKGGIGGYKAMLQADGDMKGYFEVAKLEQEEIKNKQAQEKQQLEIQAAEQKTTDGFIVGAIHNGSDWKALETTLEVLDIQGNEKLAGGLRQLMEKHQEIKGLPPEQQAAQIRPFLTGLINDSSLKKRVMADTGPTQENINPVAEPLTITKSVTPGQQLAHEDRVQKQADYRARTATKGNERIGTIPAGYRLTESGNLERMAGHPNELKDKEDIEFEAKNAKGRIEDIDQVLGFIQDAKKGSGYWTTGMTGWVGSLWRGSEAFDQEKIIDSIKANIGFERLQRMRSESKSGGALGQIAVRELDFLQAVLGSLDIGQGEKQFKNNLNKIETHYNKARKAYTQIMENQGKETVFQEEKNEAEADFRLKAKAEEELARRRQGK